MKNKYFKGEYLSSPPVVCIIAIICCMLWGSAFPCIKIGYKLFNIPNNDTAAQILFAGLRFTLAGAITLILGSISSKKFLVPEKKSILPVLKLSMVQTVMQYVLFYIGLAHTSGVKASIINASNVFLSIFFAVFLFKHEKLTLIKLIGCIIGFAGVVLINLSGSSLELAVPSFGEAAVFLSAAAYGLSSGLIKKYSQFENPVTLSGWQFLVGGIIMSISGALFGGKIQADGIGAVMLLLYLACISAAAYTLWGILLKHNDVAKVTVYGFANPLFGVVLSAMILHEQNQAFGIYGIISIVLVCAGIFLVNKAL